MTIRRQNKTPIASLLYALTVRTAHSPRKFLLVPFERKVPQLPFRPRNLLGAEGGSFRSSHSFVFPCPRRCRPHSIFDIKSCGTTRRLEKRSGTGEQGATLPQRLPGRGGGLQVAARRPTPSARCLDGVFENSGHVAPQARFALRSLFIVKNANSPRVAARVFPAFVPAVAASFAVHVEL